MDGVEVLGRMVRSRGPNGNSAPVSGQTGEAEYWCRRQSFKNMGTYYPGEKFGKGMDGWMMDGWVNRWIMAFINELKHI